MNKTVSIIIPVYNLEKYIAGCIKCVLSQSYKDIELILINDGSTDDSGKICDTFALSDKRVKVIHNRNLGVSNARNCGLIQAEGDYIFFLDGDDRIDADAIEKLVAMAEDNNADAVIFEYIIEGDGICEKHRIDGEKYNTLVNGTKGIELTISPKNRFAWSKLYRREIIEGLYFDEKIYRGEDTWFAVNALKNCDRIYYTDYAPYHYLQSENSAVRSSFNSRKLSVIDVYEYMIDFCKEYYPSLTSTAVNAYVGETIAVIYDMHCASVPRKQITEQKKRIRKRLTSEDIALLSRGAFLQLSLCYLLPDLLFFIKDRTHS